MVRDPFVFNYGSGRREVALTYRWARRVGKGQNEAVDAAMIEYRRLNPGATGDKLAVSAGSIG